MSSALKSRFKSELGQGLTEYIVLVMLVAIGSIVAVRTFGNAVEGKINNARETLNAKVPDFRNN